MSDPSKSTPIEAEIVSATLVDDAPQPEAKHWIEDLADNRAIVIGTLFLVTGVLGLPLLWISRQFTPLQKWLLSIVVTIYTLVLIVIVALVLMWSWNRIQQSIVSSPARPHAIRVAG
ncbi:hypothetical protein EC9_52750 [Rosistilla ulvae]|uniref:Uncharacterized protein n=1 Tax=Rosistilla ulvae TaxID=1930277 RepID=A0A517M846_9BACT|nr:hypothetical protein [Rosistilla ulvae]QDS91055.1 hypothetical protein EC9_52750 [Rosistilla ulvae]